MCETKANGGKRCAAHTRPRFEAAAWGTPAWDKAAAEYGRTKEGYARLTEVVMAAVSAQDWSVAAAHQSALGAADRANAAQADFNQRHRNAVRDAARTDDVDKLRKLATSNDESIVVAVALNWHTPDDVLRTLAADGSTSVRCTIASRVHAPVDVVERLAGDPDETVRFSLSRYNLDRPHSVVSIWADTDTGSRNDAAQRAQAVDAAERGGYSDILERLAGDSDYRVRASVAGKRHTPTDALRRLVDDPYRSVSMKAARHLALREPQASEVPDDAGLHEVWPWDDEDFEGY